MKKILLYNRWLVLLSVLSYPLAMSCGKDGDIARPHEGESSYKEQARNQVRIDNSLIGTWSNDAYALHRLAADTLVFDRDGMMHLVHHGSRICSMRYEVHEEGVLMVHWGDDWIGTHRYGIRYDESRHATEMYVTNNFKFDYTCVFLDTAFFRKHP